MTKYYITFSSGKPKWISYSKWSITAESRSEALHKANLMHDEFHGYDANMITISKDGASDLDEIVHHFLNLDSEEMQERILTLDRIWQQKYNKLENC